MIISSKRFSYCYIHALRPTSQRLLRICNRIIFGRAILIYQIKNREESQCLYIKTHLNDESDKISILILCLPFLFKSDQNNYKGSCNLLNYLISILQTKVRNSRPELPQPMEASPDPYGVSNGWRFSKMHTGHLTPTARTA